MKDNMPILYFDGVCNLCSSTVQFILKRNSKENLHFASLQGESGKAMLQKFGLPEDSLSSLILVEEGKYYGHSTGALRIARHLDGAWPLIYVFIILPTFIRDTVYNWIAKNRYNWFGKKEECWLPTPEFKKRFLS